MKYIKVGKRLIGEKQPCFVIAEASSNHGGSLRRAKKMIDVATWAGADAVKFQVFSAGTIAVDTQDPRTIVRQGVFVNKNTKFIDLYRSNELPRTWLPTLSDYAKAKGIMFLATPFDELAVNQLEAVGVPMHKIASYEMQDVLLLRKIAATKKPILLSTGMAYLQDIAASLEVLKRAESGPVVLLHCRSMYPTPPDQVDLRAMEAMKRKFHLPVGFSDHTLGIGVPIAAAALGACVIEKHFKLDDGVQTVDSKFSLTPGQLEIMINGIREAQVALGTGKKTPTQAEKKEKLAGARSLWVVKTIRKGEKITHENVKSLRPGIGLSPMLIDQVLGKRSKKDIAKNSPLKRGYY
jgi:pseudaminic acid synthase